MTRWGILGLGRIAHKFAADLLTLPDAQLVAVAASDQSRADEFAAKYGAEYAFGTYQDLLTCPGGLDVVYVATPHVKHHDNALMLMEAGIAVLGEKPFAMNSSEVAAMVATARRKQVFLMEALWSRFMPTIQQAHNWVQAGEIGAVRRLTANFGFQAPFLPDGRLFNKDLGGGAVLDIGIYPLFLSYLMLGMPQTLKASANIGTTGVDEQCGMVLTYENGAMALLDSTLLLKTDCVGLIQGETGTIRIHGRFHESTSVTLEKPGQEPETVDFPRQTHGYDYEAQHVMDCLVQNLTESPLWSLSDSKNLMTLLDTARL
jgi:predicted dehydrogenase